MHAYLSTKKEKKRGVGIVAFFEKIKYCLLDQARYFKDTTRKIMLLK